ncbi:hypothetical protein BDB00DRAFT_738493, partial [Zychaea mexicana]|uniref:uncharacterized protein n=1 Tax=Zychaea mexicana TaxID=64656 RepID=UPI0022FEEC6E
KSNSFKLHIRALKANWANIGYVRKSPGNEDKATRARLITCMAQWLKQQCYCRKIFASDGT